MEKYIAHSEEYFVKYTPNILKRAYELTCIKFSHEEITETLKGEDDIKKQVCLIQLDGVYSSAEAEILTSILTGQHGPVRELCSFAVNKCMKSEEMREFFDSDDIREIFLNALNDIIPSVSRNILEIINLVPGQEKIKAMLICRAFEFEKNTECKTKEKSHKLNKPMFGLYWCLAAIARVVESNDSDVTLKILTEKTARHYDYTIREKTAEILSKLSGFAELKEVLSSDSNPYVSAYFK